LILKKLGGFAWGSCEQGNEPLDSIIVVAVVVVVVLVTAAGGGCRVRKVFPP
jgi:hypothetical protein